MPRIGERDSDAAPHAAGTETGYLGPSRHRSKSLAKQRLQLGFAEIAKPQRIERYMTLQHPDLAWLAARILGVEAEHRALYRVIAQDYPANNVTLEVAQFTCASDIQRVLDPYLTGKRLPGRAHRVVALPTQAQIERVLAKMM